MRGEERSGLELKAFSFGRALLPCEFAELVLHFIPEVIK